MKSKSIDVLYGLIVANLNVPSTIEEGDNLVGEVGAVLDGFIDDTLYRNTLPRLYKAVSAKLVSLGHEVAQAVDEKTGKPVTRKVTDGEKPVMESAIVHIARVYNAGDDELKGQIAALFEEVSKELPFYEKGQRTGGGGKVSQQALDAANGILAGGVENVESKVSIIESKVPGYRVARDTDGNVSAEALARGISALQKYLQAEALKAAAGALA